MYFVTVKAGERFYLRLLLTAVKGATSFEDLQIYNGVTSPPFSKPVWHVVFWQMTMSGTNVLQRLQ